MIPDQTIYGKASRNIWIPLYQQEEKGMNAKFTPGPWEIKWDYNVFGPNERLVAACGGRTSNVKNEDAENKANTSLVAAAPDLLAAVRKVVDFVWDELRENPDKEDMDGSIMDRLIDLQTGLIQTLHKAMGE